MSGLKEPARLAGLLPLMQQRLMQKHYLHWDKLRRYSPPEGFTHREWWLALKISRSGNSKPIGLQDKKGNPFTFSIPGLVMEELHQIDLGSGGLVSVPEPMTNPHTRDRYLVSSLMEEAISSRPSTAPSSNWKGPSQRGKWPGK